MAKPSVLPRWADTVTGDATRFVAPTSGKKDVGWAKQERPAAQHLNWLFEVIYTWCAYLDTLFTDIAAENWAWTGNQTHAGTSAFAGGITGNPNFTGSPTITGTLVVNGASVTAADYKQTAYVSRYIPSVAGGPWGASLDWDMTADEMVSSGTTPEVFMIPLPAESGDTISIGITFSQSSATDAATNFILKRTNLTTGSTSNVVSVDSAAADGTGVVVKSIITDHAVVSGNAYWLQISGDGATNCVRKIYGVVHGRKRV